MDHFTRRSILRVGAVGVAGAAALAGAGAAAVASGTYHPRPTLGKGRGTDPDGVIKEFVGYGQLVEDPAGILDLPEGFTYRILTQHGDEMSDGERPGTPDGMDLFDVGAGQVALVMNHEIRTDLAQTGALLTPDSILFAGCTTIILNDDLSIADQFVSQRDTSTNCAGGKTPWGTWMTCEETYAAGAPGEGGAGFVYDVDPFTGENGPAYPAMGQFWHEAVAFDPATGIVYQTEDQSDGLLYRFIPDVRDNMSAGRLEALAITAPERAGEPVRVEWIDVTDVSRSEELRLIGAERGATPFDGCEGITQVGGSIYIDEGEGGDAGLGRIWRYQPAEQTLELFFESTDEADLRQPDNVTVQPGTDHLVHCEDTTGDNANKLVVQDSTGKVHTFAQDRTGSELAGACWSPDGRRLFVNIQQAGLTVVVEGPFQSALATERRRTVRHVAPTGGLRRADPDLVSRLRRDRGMTPLQTEAALALGLGHRL